MMLKFFVVMVICLTLIAMSESEVAAKNPMVVMETSKGTIEIELFEDKAPITVKNFLQYVKDKHYDGTIFHRVIGKGNSGKDFMIQGGGFEPGMKQKKTGAPIKNEASNGLSNLTGTLAMARTSDPDSATAQFFINVADNKFLDKQPGSDGYAVFGKVTKGMDIVNKIKDVETGRSQGFSDVPTEDVVIKSVKVKE